MKTLRKLARKIEIIWDIDTLKVCVLNPDVHDHLCEDEVPSVSRAVTVIGSSGEYGGVCSSFGTAFIVP
jgi:hypothetical protein